MHIYIYIYIYIYTHSMQTKSVCIDIDMSPRPSAIRPPVATDMGALQVRYTTYILNLYIYR